MMRKTNFGQVAGQQEQEWVIKNKKADIDLKLRYDIGDAAITTQNGSTEGKINIMSNKIRDEENVKGYLSQLDNTDIDDNMPEENGEWLINLLMMI